MPDSQINSYQLNEAKIGTGHLFPSSIEDRTPLGIGYHGTTAYASEAIERSGFKPLSDTIGISRQELLLRLTAKHFREDNEEVRKQFAAMIHVNFFPISELALKHTEQRGGQGIEMCLKPVIQKLLRMPELDKHENARSILNKWLTEIEAIQNSAPVVYAVDLQSIAGEITWNIGGAYQVRGTVSPDKIIAKLEAPNFNDYGRIDRVYLQAKTRQMARLPRHFAKTIYDRGGCDY